uniref:THD domain-containing protein n=1 Tax=Sander lucioperca TaxID=283035 RepID=A0A8D0A0K2_SANLU
MNPGWARLFAAGPKSFMQLINVTGPKVVDKKIQTCYEFICLNKTCDLLYVSLSTASLGANTTDAQYVKWHDNFGDQDNKEKSAIVIPEDGFYFVYVRIALSCNEGDFNRLYLELHNWNENYPLNRPVMKALDGCTSEGEKSVFVGQLFELSKGDNLSVWIGEGYELISTSSFAVQRFRGYGKCFYGNSELDQSEMLL